MMICLEVQATEEMTTWPVKAAQGSVQLDHIASSIPSSANTPH